MVATKTARQVGSFKRRFLIDNPLWDTLIVPPSVSTSASKSNNSPSSSILESSNPGSQQGEMTSSSGETPRNQEVVLPKSHLNTPSPSLSDLLTRGQVPEEQQLPPMTGLSASTLQDPERVVTNQHLPLTSNQRSRINLEWADKTLQALRRPATGREEAETPPSVPVMTGAQGAQPTAGGANPQTDEVLQIMEILVSSLSPSEGTGGFGVWYRRGNTQEPKPGRGAGLEPTTDFSTSVHGGQTPNARVAIQSS